MKLCLYNTNSIRFSHVLVNLKIKVPLLPSLVEKRLDYLKAILHILLICLHAFSRWIFGAKS